MNQTAYALKVLRAAITGALPVTFTGAPVGPWCPWGPCLPQWRLGGAYILTAFNDAGSYGYIEHLVEHFDSGKERVLWQYADDEPDLVDLLTPEEQRALARLLSCKREDEFLAGLPDVAGVDVGP